MFVWKSTYNQLLADHMSLVEWSSNEKRKLKGTLAIYEDGLNYYCKLNDRLSPENISLTKNNEELKKEILKLKREYKEKLAKKERVIKSLKQKLGV